MAVVCCVVCRVGSALHCMLVVVGVADVVVDAADVVAASSCLRLVGAVGVVVCMSTPVWSLVVVC